MTSSQALPFALGVDVGNPNISNPTQQASFEANLNAFSSLMGSGPQYLDQFGDQTQPISQWVSQAGWDAASVANTPALKNVIPVIGLPMSSTAAGSGTADQFYQAFAAGQYDSVLQGMVKAWANQGFTTQVWRPGWEMNISSMPSYAGTDAQTQADWVKAYQHIYTVLHAAAAADGVNLQVMWNPDVTNYSASGNAIQTVYPGNQYVDIIGADVYGDVYPYGNLSHLYDWDRSGQVLNSPNPVYDTSLQQWASDPINLMHYYSDPASNQWSLDGSVGHATTLQQLIDLAKETGKPFAIAETGAGNTADGAGLVDNPTFVQWLSQTLQQSGANVSFVNIWDSNGGGKYEFSNASDGKPLEAAAWAKYFGAVSVATPTVASFSPDSNVVGDGITNANQLTLSGTAVAGSTVEVFDGTVQIGTATADATGAWSFVTGTLADGVHSFTSQDVDSSGRVSAASTPLNVTVDTTPPAAPSISSFSPDTGVVGDAITNANQLTLTGTAEAGSKVMVFDGATQIGTATVDASGNWSFATGTLADGAHAFTSEAVDAAGNVSAASSALDVTVDTVAPNAPVLLSDTLTSSNTAVVSGTAEAGSTVKLYDGTTLLGTVVANSSGNWSITTGSLVSGAHNFFATATDVAGNSSQDSVALDLTLSSDLAVALNPVAPNAPVLLSDTLTTSNRVVVSGTAEAGSTIKLYEGSTLLGTTVVASNGTWSVTTGSLSAGAHAFTATATDAAGNVSNLSAVLDPVVGTLIDTVGSASLIEMGNNFYVGNETLGFSAMLRFAGVAQVVDPTGRVTPLGAEKTASGYEVVWSLGGGQYSIWTTDNNGNETSYVHVSGTSSTLEALETSFQQDLNGDGVIGPVAASAAPMTLLATNGSAGVAQIGNNFYVGNAATGYHAELSFAGVAQVVDPTGRVTPLGAEKTASGYEVVWSLGGGQYSIWTTDNNGNETSFVHVSGTSSTLGALESTFLQDLNGDGVINTASTVLDITGNKVLALSNMHQAATIEAGATLELTGAVSGTVKFAAATGTVVLDHATQFTGSISGLSGDGSKTNSDILDLKDIVFGSGTQASFSGTTSGGVLTVSDSQNHVAHLTLVGDYTHSTFNLSSDNSGGTLVIDPPADSFNFTHLAAPQAAPAAAIQTASSADRFVFALAVGGTQPVSSLHQGLESDHANGLHALPHDGFFLHA
ncbi:Ig-like domain-containing protein [Bradyrhizobium jicamae]|uniref:Ig-like domain-containing protein n=1 Tax=Bradyrhizobium jicamae TaxID=280332 RepID=UPI001BAAEDF4|nr:Ig-like domain-containing protein [Bradyrhizobium jicamae]MBR0934952.1 hypothetical protein [Bradyrhizobium jicamae]